jgi:hypothetical protein
LSASPVPAAVTTATKASALPDAEFPEGEHLITGFDEDCGCGATTADAAGAHNHSHAADTATKPAAVATPAPAPAVAVPPAISSRSTGEWHSRMMRPSGYSTGNNPIASAAESQRMRLEDDGVGWVNSDNLKQKRGHGHSSYNIGGGATAGGGRVAKGSPAAAAFARGEHPEAQQGEEHGADAADAAAAALAEKPKRIKSKKPKKRVKVACLTTDFSMQNVLLQMRLHVMAVDGLMIKSAKQWVLRCMGCFEVHYDMDRLFCRKCGGSHLSRVSASIDAGGSLKLHLKKNYHVDLKGSKYNLPAPGKQGRYQGEILLREDQLLSGIWKQKCVKIRKDIKSAFGEDVTSDVGMHINKGQAIKIGLGKNNPNAAKGRERRGKSKRTPAK